MSFLADLFLCCSIVVDSYATREPKKMRFSIEYNLARYSFKNLIYLENCQAKTFSMASLQLPEVADFHAVSEDGKHSFLWRNKQLTYIAPEKLQMPPLLASKFGPLTKRLDLSYNSLQSADNLDFFTQLEELILDNNKLEDENLSFRRENKKLKLISLNKNKLSDLRCVVSIIRRYFPNLQFLSLIGNPLCPLKAASNSENSCDSNDKRTEFYNLTVSEPASSYERQLQAYRYYIIRQLPNLRFLDSRPILQDERNEASRWRRLFQVRFLYPSSSVASDEPQVEIACEALNCNLALKQSQAPTKTEATPQLKLPATCSGKTNGKAKGEETSHLSSESTGKSSETNRFKCNSELGFEWIPLKSLDSKADS